MDLTDSHVTVNRLSLESNVRDTQTYECSCPDQTVGTYILKTLRITRY